MHILVVASRYPCSWSPKGGVFARDQARALQRAGHKVTFAAINLGSACSRRPIGLRRFTDDGIEVFYYSVPLSPLKFTFGAVGRHCFRTILRRVRAELGTPDIVHAHFLGVSSIIASVCQEENLPLVITEHSSTVNAPELKASVLRNMRKTYPKANAVLAVGSMLSENIFRATGVRATVVPNVVDTQIFCPANGRCRENGCFRFSASGSLIQRKGYDLLLRAVGELRRRGYSLQLTVFGEGAERNELQKLAEAEGIDDCVDFRGHCSRKNLAEAYAESDAFVLASRWETFGVVYIEAMAAGLPVIATRCSGPEDFVTEKDGILIPTDDVGALTDAMEHIILHRSEYDSASIAASAKERFSPERIAARLTAIYEEVLSC